MKKFVMICLGLFLISSVSFANGFGWGRHHHHHACHRHAHAGVHPGAKA